MDIFQILKNWWNDDAFINGRSRHVRNLDQLVKILDVVIITAMLFNILIVFLLIYY